MNLQERVLNAVGTGIEAKALYAKCPAESPAVLDCALSALIRARLLELACGVYRRPDAGCGWRAVAKVQKRRTSVPQALQARSALEIRADLCCQLEDAIARWDRLLAEDRAKLRCG